MIGYNRLGSNGRLGNQMFQYAGLRGIAANRGFDWKIPPPGDSYEANYGLFDCFKMGSVNEKNIGFVPQNFPTVKSQGFDFDEEFYNQCLDNVNLEDYFQTEKYFKNIEQIIREDFEFIDEYLNPCKEFISSFDSEVIFLHVRRTDYVNLSKYHPVCSQKYYQDSLKEFDDELPVLVFSDDIEWCKKQDIFSDDRFLFSENQETFNHLHKDADGEYRKSLLPYTDLCLMSLCSHAIIANSSMSWWGAWLIKNKNKKIIAPTPWFGPEGSHNNTKDLIPESWVVKEI